MRFRPTYRSIWGVSFPIIIAGISETIIDITDTIFLARYGITELAAVGLADAIYGVALFISLGLVDGIQITIGRRAGQEQDLEIGRVFNQGLYLLVFFSIALIIVIKFIIPGITIAIMVSGDVHNAVNAYLQITAYALLFQSLNLAYSAFYVGIGKTKVLIGVTTVLAVTNIVLDYTLIFGNFGMPELGIEGAAIASLTAEIAAFTYFSIDILRKYYFRDYGLFRFTKWDKIILLNLLRLSAPVSAEALVETLKWFAFFLILEQLGENVLASGNIIYSCLVLFLIPIDGFSETVCSMVSNIIGQQRLAQLRVLIHKSIKLAYFSVAPLLLIALFSPDLVLSIFTPDEPLISAAQNSLIVVILTTLIVVPGGIFYAAVAGTGDTRAILVIQTIMAICTISIAYYSGLILGLAMEYIWLAEMAGWVICFFLSWYWFQSRRWERLVV
ncbi:MATE family efflux transporter [Kaarinaea lacus]